MTCDFNRGERIKCLNLIKEICRLSYKSKNDGLLSLEEDIKNYNDNTLERFLIMAMDGVPVEIMYIIFKNLISDYEITKFEKLYNELIFQGITQLYQGVQVLEICKNLLKILYGRNVEVIEALMLLKYDVSVYNFECLLKDYVLCTGNGEVINLLKVRNEKKFLTNKYTLSIEEEKQCLKLIAKIYNMAVFTKWTYGMLTYLPEIMVLSNEENLFKDIRKLYVSKTNDAAFKQAIYKIYEEDKKRTKMSEVDRLKRIIVFEALCERNSIDTLLTKMCSHLNIDSDSYLKDMIYEVNGKRGGVIFSNYSYQCFLKLKRFLNLNKMDKSELIILINNLDDFEAVMLSITSPINIRYYVNAQRFIKIVNKFINNENNKFDFLIKRNFNMNEINNVFVEIEDKILDKIFNLYEEKSILQNNNTEKRDMYI